MTQNSSRYPTGVSWSKNLKTSAPKTFLEKISHRASHIKQRNTKASSEKTRALLSPTCPTLFCQIQAFAYENKDMI